MMTPLCFGNVQADLAFRDGYFKGLAEITIAGVKVRSGRIPMAAKVRTPFGVEMVENTLLDMQQNDDGIVLKRTAKARHGAVMEWMLHECRARVNTRGWEEEAQPVDDLCLTTTLKPVERCFGPYASTGFSYQYTYTCPSYPTYVITDHSSWEIGGSATGNTIYMRGALPPVQTIEDAATPYTTEWYVPGITNPNIFQFKPFQTCMQGFTLTVSNGGALLTWATEVAHIRTLLEKQRGAEELEHWHEHCSDLGPELSTSPMEILWIPGDFSSAASLANLYFQINEVVTTELHEQIGFRRERISTIGYMAEWDFPKIRDYVEKGTPKLLEAGVRTVGISSMFEHNLNTYGVGNQCCTVDYKVAETMGEENVKAICDQVHDAGGQVQMWGNTAISSLAWKFFYRNGPEQRIDHLPLEGSIMDVLQEAKAPFVRNAFGAIEGDHYSLEFCQLNLLDPTVRDYWNMRWKDAHDRIGIDGIFLDSSFNLSSDKFHWSYWPEGVQKGATIDQTDLHGNYRPAIEPQSQILSQYMAHLSLMAEMQQYGYHYSGEDTGVFGLKRSGPDAVNRMQAFCLWADSYCHFDPSAIIEAGEDADRVFFKGLAYRLMWLLWWVPCKDKLSWRRGGHETTMDEPSDVQLALLCIYNKVEDIMREQLVLEDEVAIIYPSESGMIVWSVDATEITLDHDSEIENLLTEDTWQAQRLTTDPNQVYRITFL